MGTLGPTHTEKENLTVFKLNRKLALLVFLLMFAAMACNTCATLVEVPPAHVGKMSTASGLQEGIMQPSKMRIAGWCRTCESLVLVEASDYPVTETLKLFMPKDQLNLDLDVRGTFTISADESNVDQIFARITAESLSKDSGIKGGGGGLVTIIPIEKVYETYARPVIRETVRTILIKYSISDIMENREAIGRELRDAVFKKLASTPIKPLFFGLADIQPPGIIVKAQEAAKKREIELREAEAQKQIDIKGAQARFEVAQKQQAVDFLEAETQVVVNKKLAESVSPAFLMQRYMRFLQTLAENDNKTLIMPIEAMQSFGGQMRVWGFNTEGMFTVKERQVPVEVGPPGVPSGGYSGSE